MIGRLSIFSGNANPELSKGIAAEIAVELDENVRGRDVFIIQPTCPPTNDNLMELLIMTDAMRRSSAGRVTAIVPYFGYAPF